MQNTEKLNFAAVLAKKFASWF